MAYPHIISALSIKLSQIQGEIELHYRAIKELEIFKKQSLLNFLQNEGFTHQKIANFTLQELALKSYKNED